MEDTTRVFAVLAALTLALAPVTNGVLEKAAQTADRVILEPADWDREPPEDPPNATPPEDLPEGNRSFEGAGARPQCEVETEPAAVWNHPDDPSSPNRTVDGTQATVTVNDTHIGIGVALEIENLDGRLEASLQHENGTESFSYEHEALSGRQAEVNRTSTVSGDDLETGEWTAELTHRTANYDRLTYVIVLASCAGGSG
ncbi:hypothetical protein BRD56_03005 [Thermoplasmatales archaeon SW_10_69_26]|nr:MAG: hypothetical protein BRD56_03005 [Thermoplasmatales archaeon SW_10_69_26]